MINTIEVFRNKGFIQFIYLNKIMTTISYLYFVPIRWKNTTQLLYISLPFISGILRISIYESIIILYWLSVIFCLISCTTSNILFI